LLQKHLEAIQILPPAARESATKR